MTLLRNRRSNRALLVGVASGLLILGPASLAAQQDTTTVPKTHTVKRGDTLWDLAAKYLGDAFRWPELYRLNTDVVEDPHWIYPGEILKLPGYVATATPTLVEPAKPAIIDTTPVRIEQRPTNAFEKPQSTARTLVDAPVDTPMTVVARPVSTVKYGDFIRAPWVDRLKGPPVWGRIVGSADLPGIEPARQRGRFQLNDRILIAPPAGSVSPEREMYLAYHNGPLLEEVGQVIVPTGVIEVIRPPINGDAAIARIVRMFGEVSERDRLMPYDSSAMGFIGSPKEIRNGAEGKVRWVPEEPVLPSINYFIVLTLTSNDVKTGDIVELYKARKKATDEGEFGVPEITVGRAQVIKATPQGATAMITILDQPKVEKGLGVRVVAKMQ